MKRKIPLKNYIILAVVVVIFVLLVFYMRDWYNTTKGYYNGSSPVLEVSTKINKEELNNYVLENPNFILYVTNGYNESVSKFEKSFKNYIVKNNVKNVLYLDASETTENEINNYLINNFTDDSQMKDKITNSHDVTIYNFEGGRIVNVIDNANKKTMKTVNKIFERYEVLDND